MAIESPEVVGSVKTALEVAESAIHSAAEKVVNNRALRYKMFSLCQAIDSLAGSLPEQTDLDRLNIKEPQGIEEEK